MVLANFNKWPKPERYIHSHPLEVDDAKQAFITTIGSNCQVNVVFVGPVLGLAYDVIHDLVFGSVLIRPLPRQIHSVLACSVSGMG